MPSPLLPALVNEAFLAAPPLISAEIRDLSVLHPSWLRDLPAVEPWPTGTGTVMQQLIFRGGRPQIERGFDKWKKVANVQGCAPCAGPDCSYNWTPFGGHGFDVKLTELMRREFNSPQYCVHEIQTTAHFREVFAKIVENLYAQVDFFKEQNIAMNFLTMLAKKFVIDSGGAKGNPANPYVYRNTGSARLSTMNIAIFEFFYEHMRRIPDVVPFDVVDGAPVYAALVGAQLLSRMYRDDQQLREDVRFSGLANDMLMKYNFMSTIRGMFIPAPILYPRRFNLVNGEPMEVLPFVNDVPADVGTYTYLNPAYEAATHEEIILHGRAPFKIFVQQTEGSLGENTSFGPEDSFMNTWSWINPMTNDDPFRRQGYFATAANIGLSQQWSDGIFSILLERPSSALMAMYTPNPVCPEAPEDCDNTVPEVGCPCPLVLDITANPMAANTYYFRFAAEVTGEEGNDVQLQLDNGAYITGSLVGISADGRTAEISFTTDLSAGVCTQIVGIYCDSSLGCSALVDNVSDCRAGETGNIKLILSNAIKAITAADVITAYFGDCTTANLDVVSVDLERLEWTVNYAAGFGPSEDTDGNGGSVLMADFLCDRGGIIKVCVPPSTDATCPACEASLELCESEITES